MDRFQDRDGPLLQGLGIFHNGRLVADAPDNVQRAGELRNRLDAEYPGCEVLARCNIHMDTAAVDCLICWPLDEE